MAALDPISRAVSGLKFARQVTGIDFTFQPSIGLIARDVDKLGLELTSFKEPLTLAIEIVMIPSIRENFNAGGRPIPWEPLAPYTVKERDGSTEPILFRTGTLLEAASSLGIWEISDNGAVITSLPESAWYGALHQAGHGSYKPGSKGKSGKSASKVSIPARPFILFQDQDLDDITEVFRLWLEDKVREAGW